MSVSTHLRAWLPTLLLLFAAYLGGVHLRAHRLDASLANPQGPFWLESAQHYRGIRYIAEGKALPSPDRQIQWPDGFDPRQDTVVQEYVIGGLARLFQPTDLPGFVRAATRYVYCLIAFPLFWLCYELTRRRWAALFAVVFFLCLPAAVDRSTGLVVFRENVALPIVAAQVAALYAHFRRETGSAWAWTSGALLLLAHFTWKVSSFYQLFVLGFLALICLWERPGPKVRMAVYALAVPPLLVSLTLPVALNVDRYWGSLQAALTWALLALCLAARFVPERVRSPWVRGGLLLVILLGVRAVLPGPISYDHAWDTLIAKARFLGEKPEDPSKLSIHARHYWTGNYRSPTLARATRDFLLPGLMALWLLRRLGRGRRVDPAAGPSSGEAGERAGQGSRFLDTIGLGGQDRFGRLFLMLGLAGFAVGYLLFVKFGTFLAVFITPAVAMGALTMLEQAKHRAPLAKAVLIGVLGIGFTGAWTGIGAESMAYAVHQPDGAAAGQESGLVYNQVSINALSSWIGTQTRNDEAFLTSWALAPYLFTYLDRPTNLHSFFECEVVLRFEEFNERLFGPIEELHAFARRYDATWLVIEANFLLRTDPWMSYRYVADHLDIRGDEAAYRLHYGGLDDGSGEALSTPGFELVHQDEFFRVFRVLPTAQEVRTATPGGAIGYAALFDPRVPGAQPGRVIEDGPALLYGTLDADRWLQLGQALEAAGKRAEALEAFRQGLRVGPYHARLYLETLELLATMGEVRAARQLHDVARSRFGPALPLPAP